MKGLSGILSFELALSTAELYYIRSQITQSLVDSQCSLILQINFCSYLDNVFLDLLSKYHNLVHVESILKPNYQSPVNLIQY